MKIRLQPVLLVTLAAFALLHGVILWRTRDPILRGYGDFASFYTAGKIVQRGESASLYNRNLQWQLQREFAPQVSIRNVALPYVRPPFEALLFLPFACLNYPAAVVTWTLVKIILLIATPFLLPQENLRHLHLPFPPLLQGFVSLGFLPVAFDLLLGQDSIPFLLLLAAAFALMRKRADFRAGACLGLGLFKFHLVIPLLLVLLFRRKTRVILGFMCIACVLTLLSIALVGWSGLAQYPKYLWELNRSPNLIGINGLVMPNIRGLFSPILGPARVPFSLQIGLLLISVLGVISMAKIWNGEVDASIDYLGFSCCIVITLVTSYYTAIHDLTLLLLPIFLASGFFACDSTVRGWPRVAFIASTTLLLLAPVSWVIAIPITELYWLALPLLVLATSLVGTVRLLSRRLAVR